MRKHKHIGSSFDDFLEEEGILEECKEEATKREEGLCLAARAGDEEVKAL